MDKNLIATLSLIASVVLGFVWLQTHFITRGDAEAAHGEFATDVTRIYLELKIDNHNGALEFMEKDGIDEHERRDYDLLKAAVERMHIKLQDLQR